MTTTTWSSAFRRSGFAPSLGIREISVRASQHLHQAVRELEPTQEEWAAAITLLTRAGRMCNAIESG